ncbi:MAG: prepilin-type N-terminal cleavage/methylation domain-containing protein [Syntrophaceae bacterium]
MKTSKGFSLIEVLIALVVFAVIGTIAGLNLHAYTLNRNLKSAAREIASDFFLCKQKAASESTTYQIVFNVAGGSYTIQTTTGVPPAVTKSIASFGKDITIASASFTGSTVNFQSRGAVSTPSGALNVGGDSVVLQNSRNSTATITVTTMGRTNVTFNIQ